MGTQFFGPVDCRAICLPFFGIAVGDKSVVVCVYIERLRPNTGVGSTGCRSRGGW
jgi:hypothetical protein